jgi:phage terminase Nu1 subunit (DNA packaging protein)
MNTHEQKVIRGFSSFARVFGTKDSRTVHKWMQKGMPFMHDGKNYLFDVADVGAWIKDNFTVKIPSI